MFSLDSPIKHPLGSPIKSPNSVTSKRFLSFDGSESSSPTKKKPAYDRFIPSRSSLDQEYSNFYLRRTDKEKQNPEDTTPAKEAYKSLLAQTLFSGKSPTSVLPVSEPPASPYRPSNVPVELLNLNQEPATPSQQPQHFRQIPKIPFRVLDAPDLMDDYYLNLLDWGQNNMVAIALASNIYLWNANTGSSCKLMQNEEHTNNITSLSFSKTDPNILAIGSNDSEIQLWDLEKNVRIRKMGGHSARVTAMDWRENILTTGARDSIIVNHDPRVESDNISVHANHTQEICGLKWSPDGALLASGGNDNLLNIWDHGSTTPRYTFEHHEAAVKAMDWCPWQSNLLASGGGTADRTLRFWNTSTGSCINFIDTRSQVCAVKWSLHYRELVSSHGFSQNQLIVWKYPKMTKIAELKAHTSRVLHMVLSPDGKTVASAAADETLRFWKVFDYSASIDKKTPKIGQRSMSFNISDIR